MDDAMQYIYEMVMSCQYLPETTNDFIVNDLAEHFPISALILPQLFDYYLSILPLQTCNEVPPPPEPVEWEIVKAFLDDKLESGYYNLETTHTYIWDDLTSHFDIIDIYYDQIFTYIENRLNELYPNGNGDYGIPDFIDSRIENSTEMIDFIGHMIISVISIGLIGLIPVIGTLIVDLIRPFFSYPIDQYVIQYYAYSKLGLTDYINLNRRGLLTTSSLNAKAMFLGYNETELNNALNITKFFPNARDLVDFAVREAFEPDDKLFIHGGNAIPEPFITWSEKVGLTYEWIKKFWHSHWRLLGAQEMLEAFHRDIVSEIEMKDYLRRLDYTEQDREVLLGMSYNLITRVDIRRLFENGLISSADIFKHYKKLGYSDDDSTLMTLLAKQIRFIDTKDLRVLLLKEYEMGLLTDSEIKERLKETGLDSDDIERYLTLSESEYRLERIGLIKNKLEKQFYEGLISFDYLVESLRQLGISNREIKRIQDYSKLFEFKEKALPTKAELSKFLKKEIIDLDTFIYYMTKRGYSMDVIFMYLQEIFYG